MNRCHYLTIVFLTSIHFLLDMEGALFAQTQPLVIEPTQPASKLSGKAVPYAIPPAVRGPVVPWDSPIAAENKRKKLECKMLFHPYNYGDQFEIKFVPSDKNSTTVRLKIDNSQPSDGHICEISQEEYYDIFCDFTGNTEGRESTQGYAQSHPFSIMLYADPEARNEFIFKFDAESLSKDSGIAIISIDGKTKASWKVNSDDKKTKFFIANTGRPFCSFFAVERWGEHSTPLTGNLFHLMHEDLRAFSVLVDKSYTAVVNERLELKFMATRFIGPVVQYNNKPPYQLLSDQLASPTLCTESMFDNYIVEKKTITFTVVKTFEKGGLRAVLYKPVEYTAPYVLAFAGTNPNILGDPVDFLRDLHADVFQALFIAPTQFDQAKYVLLEAVDFIETDIDRSKLPLFGIGFPLNNEIVLTGHSLGGGLAAYLSGLHALDGIGFNPAPLNWASRTISDRGLSQNHRNFICVSANFDPVSRSTWGLLPGRRIVVHSREASINPLYHHGIAAMDFNDVFVSEATYASGEPSAKPAPVPAPEIPRTK